MPECTLSESLTSAHLSIEKACRLGRYVCHTEGVSSVTLADMRSVLIYCQRR
jgi:hypothetical protein